MAPSPYIFIISIGPAYMKKYARFDEIPSMTLKDIKETKRYGRMHGPMDGRTDNVKTVYPPPQTQFAGGIKRCNVCINGLYMILHSFIFPRSLRRCWKLKHLLQKFNEITAKSIQLFVNIR